MVLYLYSRVDPYPRTDSTLNLSPPSFPEHSSYSWFGSNVVPDVCVYVCVCDDECDPHSSKHRVPGSL